MYFNIDFRYDSTPSMLTAVHYGSLYAASSGHLPHTGRQGRSPQPTSPETLIIPAHAPKVHLSPDVIEQLHFKPTVGSLQLSEGHEAKFNCSIDVPDAQLDLIIVWLKNDMELAENMQVVINELQTVTHDVITVLSTVR